MMVIYRIFVLLIAVGFVIGIMVVKPLFESAAETKTAKIQEEISQEAKAHIQQERRIFDAERDSLKREIAGLQRKNSTLERDNDDKKSAIEKLQRELHPETLPRFSQSDIATNKLRLSRIYSVKAGRCFDVESHSSCFFAAIKQADNVGYILYKTNGSFDQSLVDYTLTDFDGNRLVLLTEENRVTIEAWETQNPNHALRMSFM